MDLIRSAIFALVAAFGWRDTAPSLALPSIGAVRPPVIAHGTFASTKTSVMSPSPSKGLPEILVCRTDCVYRDHEVKVIKNCEVVRGRTTVPVLTTKD